MHAATSTLQPAAATLQRLQAVAAMGRKSAADAQAVDSNDLLRGQKAVAITHNGAVYRLQTTKLGKLILTK